MNVFVLSTGRAGSTTFARACAHITNYTTDHESRHGVIGPERLEYPANHIEADNRLTWMLGRLYERYGDDAFYVHLLRAREETARSFDFRWDLSSSIIRAYAVGVLCSKPYDHNVCLDYWDTVNANVRVFLADRPHTATVRLEHAESDFAAFWDAIGARGDKGKARLEWCVSHNATQSQWDGRAPVSRVLRKGLRVAQKLPAFLRGA